MCERFFLIFTFHYRNSEEFSWIIHVYTSGKIVGSEGEVLDHFYHMNVVGTKVTIKRKRKHDYQEDNILQ